MEELSFKPFAKLPIELGLKIWSHAATIQQIIRVRDPGGSEALEGNLFPLFLVSKEARDEVLRVRKGHCSGGLPCRFLSTNLEQDILWLEGCTQPIVAWTRSMIWLTGSKLIHGLKESAVRHLAFSYKFWYLVRNSYGLGLPWIMTLNLEEIILVVDSDEMTEDEVATFTDPRNTVSSPECANVFKSWKSLLWIGRSYVSWDQMAQSEMDDLERCRARYQQNSEEAQQAGGIFQQGHSSVDPSTWITPRIRFADAVRSRPSNI